MTDELVKQLRDMARVDGCRASIAAADRIEQLTAERDEALECNEQFSVDNQFLKKRVEKAEADFARQVQRTDEQREAYEQALSVMEAERDRLREALQSLHAFADGWRQCGCGDNCYGRHVERDAVLDHLHDFATAALKGETP